MYKWVHTIGVILLLSVFLVSSTGFRLIRHSCQVCNIVEYSFDGSQGCCEAEAIVKPTLPIEACCSTLQIPANTCEVDCCDHISEYFITDNTVTVNSLRIPVLAVQIIEALQAPGQICTDLFSQPLILPRGSPWNSHSGKQFLVSIQQLKFDCLIS